MSHDFKADLGLEIRDLIEVPHHLDILPDGREVLVIGDPEGYKKFNHKQGDNPHGYKQVCGLVACQDILLQFEIQVSEANVVDYAVRHKLCENTGKRSERGGTTPQDQVKILNDFGIPAHFDTFQSLEELAAVIEQDKGVIIEVNAGELWQDHNDDYSYGQADHAVVVTGLARNPHTSDIVGFYINDSGTGKSGQFVDAAIMRYAWEDTGGMCITTNITHSTTLRRK